MDNETSQRLVHAESGEIFARNTKLTLDKLKTVDSTVQWACRSGIPPPTSGSRVLEPPPPP
jgi:hypothetical protein